MSFYNVGYAINGEGVLNGTQFTDFYIDGDDFEKRIVTAEDYVATQAGSAGTYLPAAGVDCGAVALDAGHTDAGDGIQIQRPVASFTPKAGRTIWFTTKLKCTYPTKMEFFAGLAEIDTTILASAAISTSNHIGFTSTDTTTDGNYYANSEKADANAKTLAGAFTSGTYVTLAFKVSGLDSITFYVNGTPVAYHTTAYIPTAALAPSIVCQSNGTNQPVLTVDYWKCVQTR